MAEGNEHLTLHTESIDAIVAVLRGDQSTPGQGRRDTIANTIDAQR